MRAGERERNRERKREREREGDSNDQVSPFSSEKNVNLEKRNP